MTKFWSDVSASPEFQALSFEDQEAARRQYFDDVIAPQVGDDVDAARAQFDNDTRPRRQPLPAGVPESDAGSGRGGAEFAATDPRRNAMRRGGTRSEARPYVAGDAGTGVAEPEQEVAGRVAPTAGQMLEWPRQGPETAADLDVMSMSPAAQERARAEAVAAAQRRRFLDASKVKPLDERGVVERAVDATVRKPLDNSLAGAVVEGYGDAWRGGIRAFQGAGGAAWAGVQAAAAKAGADDVERFAGAAGAAARDARSAFGNASDRDSITQQVFESTFQNLPLLAAGPAALPAMAAMAAANDYGESRDRGLTDEQALPRAVWMGVAEAAGERFGLPALGKLFRQAAASSSGSDMAKTLANLIVKEQAGEQVTLGLQNLYEATGPQGTKPNLTLEQYLQEAADTALVTAGQSLLTGGVAAGVRRLARPPEPDGLQMATDLAKSKGFLGGVEAPQPTSFTPADSAVAAAGITPVVAPVPVGAAPQVEVGTDGITPPRTGRPDFSRAMTAVDDRARADAAAEAAPGPAQQPAPGQAVVGATQAPAASWTGRRGDGYVNDGDAQQALPGRQRKRPDLDWRAEPRPDGRWVLNGYARQQQEVGDGRQGTGIGLDAGPRGQDQAERARPIDGTGIQPGRERPDAAAGATEIGGAVAPAVEAETLRRDLAYVQDTRLRRGEVTRLEAVADANVQPEARALAAVFGSPVTIVRDANKKARFGAVVVNKERIYLNEAAVDAPLKLTVHEIVHTLPAGIRNALVERAMLHTTPELKQQFLWKYESYEKDPESKQNEEMVAMFAQDDAKTPQFWTSLRDKLGDSDFGKLAKHILSVIDKIMSRVRDGDDRRFFTDIEAVRDLVTEAMAKASRGETHWNDDLAVAGDGGVDVNEISIDEAGFSESGPRKWQVTDDNIPSKELAQRIADNKLKSWGDGYEFKVSPSEFHVNGSFQVESRKKDRDAQFSERGRTEEVGGYTVKTFRDGGIEVAGDIDEIRAQIPGDVKGRATAAGIKFTTSDSALVRAALEGRDVAYSRAGAVTSKMPMKGDKYLGAPPGFDTPAKIPKLRRILRQLAEEGADGRFWYESSGKAVLDMVGGNVSEARKFVALLAIYSPQAKVDANSTFALRAWAQHKAGKPISVKTAVMDKKAADALADVDKFWSGEKTGNFFHNLLREIDPGTADRQGATIDMWMMRAGQYDNDAPTKTQYAFMENETNRLARDLGWEPQQVQAAIWVAMKARMENAGVKKRTEAKSEKRGLISFKSDGKGKKVRVIHDAQRHRNNWLETAMAHEPTAADTGAAKFDFGDGIRRHIGQVSWEARPSRVSGVLPGVNDAPYALQVEFQQAVQRALVDDNGVDLLARELGLLVEGDDILAPGAWQGEISAGMQKQMPMAPAKGDDGKTKVDDAQKQALNTYAAVLGLLLRQDGLGWHRPFYSSRKRDANGLDIRIGRVVNDAEMRDLYAAIDKYMGAKGISDWQDKMALVSSPTGVRVINFGAVDNDVLHSDFVEAISPSMPDGDVVAFASDGDMPTNNWETDRNGQAYVQRIGEAGRSDLLDWARAVLAPRVQAVFDDFSSRYGWGDAGTIDFSDAGDGGRGEDGGGQAPLAGAPNVRGATGPDPRLNAVAEAYAKANGIALTRQSQYVDVDTDRARRIAAAYAAMPHAPQDPRVREAYENLVRQTRAQYEALVDAGYRFWFMDPGADPYAGNPWNAMRDLRQNQRMAVYPTAAGFGSDDAFDASDNPLLADTGISWGYGAFDGPAKPVLANDLFRAVHDAFGHGLEGAGFRARGEENAWQAHVRLFTGSAVGALTSETRGQNSWLNFGPYGEVNQTARVEDTVFADQKTGLMPDWTWREGVVVDGAVDASEFDPSIKQPLYAQRQVTNADEIIAWARSQGFTDIEPAEKMHVTIAYSKAPVRGDDLPEAAPNLRAVAGGRSVAELGDAGAVVLKFQSPDLQRRHREYKAAGASWDFPTYMPHVTITYHKGDVDLKKVKPYDGDIEFGPETQSAIKPRTEDPDVQASDTPRFYSALARAITKGPKQAAPDQWRMFIRGLTQKGVKAEEIEWSGVEDWLKLQTGKVARDAVAAYLEAGGVKVEEVVLGGFDKGWRLTPGDGLTSMVYGETDLDELEADKAEFGGTVTEIKIPKDGDTKYSKYTLPGGTNYREVLLTLPAPGDSALPMTFDEWLDAKGIDPIDDAEPELRARYRREVGKQSDRVYQSSHWDQPNVLAHIRVNDRVDADGKRVLFVEEIQSDWAQQGRKRGFGGKYRIAYNGQPLTPLYDTKAEAESWAARMGAAEGMAVVEEVPGVGTPAAPFVTKTDSWLGLALKRIITMAIDGGYDGVAFVTGEQAADRFDLSKQIDAIDYRRVEVGAGDEFELDLVKDGSVQQTIGVREADLEDHVGKDVAKKIIAGDGARMPGRDGRSPMTRLSGLDLRVGGDGMKSFYDVIVPGAVRSLLKKLGGGQLERFRLGDRDDTAAAAASARADGMADGAAELEDDARNQAGMQPGFAVTDAMREAASDGLPLFSDYEQQKAAFGRDFLPGQVPPRTMRVQDLKVGSVKSDAAVVHMTRWIDDEYPIVNAARKAGSAVGDAWVQAVEALPGRTADAVDQARRRFVDPLSAAIAKAAKAADIEPAQIVDAYGVYRLAMHAPERNKTLRDGGSKKANPSGMSEAEAAQWMTFFRGEPELLASFQGLDPLLKAIQTETDRVKMAAGLLTQADVDSRSDWKWYISLRGDPGADAVGGVRGGGNWNNDVDPRARGRDSLSANPVVNTIKMLENGIRLAEMARVKKATYDFATAHPKVIGATVTRLRQVPLHYPGGAFAKTEPNRDKFDADAIVYRDGDTEYHIEIGDGMVLESIKRMEKVQAGVVANGFGKLTSAMGRLWTQFSPHFPFSNFIRDLQQQLAFIAGSDIEIGGKKVSSAAAAFRILTRYPRTFAAAVSEVMGRTPTGKYTGYARELAAAGGVTGWTKMLSDDEAVKDFVKDVAQRAGKANTSLLWDKFVDAVAGVSEVFELTTRVAAYSVMRDMGMPQARATQFTKNLINFSKAGTETRGLAKFYMFLRPALQDVYLTSKLLRTRKGAIVFASLYASSVALYMMLRELSGDDDEDKRLKKMDKRPASERRGYYILPFTDKQGQPVRVPVGFGLPRMAWGLATATVDSWRNPDYDAADAADNAFKSLTSTLSPLQLSDINMFKEPFAFLATTLAPTLFVPMAELAINKTKAGNSISRNNAFQTLPDYARAYASTPKEWKDAMAWMYDNSNGKIDIAPETVQHLVRSYGGGPATIILNALATRERLRQGQDISGRDLPIVQAYLGPRDRYPERRFRQLSDEIDAAAARIKDSNQRGDGVAARMLSDKETALKASLKKRVDRIERAEAKRMEELRRLQITDYDEGARQLRLLERDVRREKQGVLDAFNSKRMETEE